MSKFFSKLLLGILVLFFCTLSSSGLAAAGYEDYQPGTLTVRIPELFMPPLVEVEVEVPNTDPVPTTPLPSLDPATGMPLPVRPRTKKIKKWVKPPSPYRNLNSSDFTWIRNDEGHYGLPLAYAYGSNPFAKLPLKGPMLLRTASSTIMIAVTVDDPNDIVHYRNQDSLPQVADAQTLLTETRPNMNVPRVNCTYQRGTIGGVTCLIVRMELARGVKTYRLLAAFPEDQKNDFLPYTLYSIENFNPLS